MKILHPRRTEILNLEDVPAAMVHCKITSARVYYAMYIYRGAAPGVVPPPARPTL